MTSNRAAAQLRPEGETAEPVYANCDHQLNAAVVAELEANPSLCAQHASWNFCGYVWRGRDGVWRDEVWRYHSPVQTFEGESAQDVIDAANDTYGHD